MAAEQPRKVPPTDERCVQCGIQLDGDGTPVEIHGKDAGEVCWECSDRIEATLPPTEECDA